MMLIIIYGILFPQMGAAQLKPITLQELCVAAPYYVGKNYEGVVYEQINNNWVQTNTTVFASICANNFENKFTIAVNNSGLVSLDNFVTGFGPPNIFGAYQLQQYFNYNITQHQPKNTWAQSFNWYFQRQENNISMHGSYSIICSPFGKSPYIQFEAFYQPDFLVLQADITIFYYKDACPCIFLGHDMCRLFDDE